jgi:type IV pilus assembly protein PilE
MTSPARKTIPFNSSTRTGHLQNGFTLIEVMITVAIVGILSAVAYPSYTDHIRRSRVADSLALLSKYQLTMEQASQDNGNYGTTACAVAVPAATAYFTISCTLGTGGLTYVATATGTGPLAGNVYTINESGTKATTAYFQSVTLPAACWLMRKGDC